MNDSSTVEELNPNALDAMEALFQFSEAMEGKVSILDLMKVMQMAIATGRDLLLIQLSMALEALKRIEVK